MQATLTEAHRDTRRVMRAASQGRTVTVTEHGKPLARISAAYPVRQLSAAEFRQLDIPESELNEAINQAVAEVRA